MIEEAALGDAGLGDDLLDRGRAEALFQNARLRDGENAVARRDALAHGRTSGKLYRWYGLKPPQTSTAAAAHATRTRNLLKNR
ncbi:hypothetical protein D3C87_1927480 [compost metagenome]